MNIFAVDQCPVTSARSLCDKHVVKMTLETSQMLCENLILQGVDPDQVPVKLYRAGKGHINHPCSIWARQTSSNYLWLAQHGLALSHEYTHRYGRVHACNATLLWAVGQYELMPGGPLTPFALAMREFAERMGDRMRTDDPVYCYRMYYKFHKREMKTWNKGRPKPSWMN